MKNLIFLFCGLLFSLNLFAEKLSIEKKYNIFDETGKPIKNMIIKTFLIQTVVYNDGKNNEFEGTICEEVFYSNLTSNDGVFNLKLQMEDLSKEEHVKNKKIKKKNLELYIICDGYRDFYLTLGNEDNQITMIKNAL